MALSDPYDALFYISALTLGLLVGSFLNVVIYRLPKILDRQWRLECTNFLDSNAAADGTPKEKPDAEKPGGNGSDIEKPERYSLAWPGSHCPHCNAKIRPWHNIPLIGYALLRGKCADCHTAISPRYPIFEFICGILSLLVILEFGASYQGLFGLGLTWALIALAGIDLDTKLLPDNITLPLLWAGLIVNAFTTYVPLIDALWGAVAGYITLWAVFWMFKLVTGKEGMGYGDFKLLAALGAWMGWSVLPMIILVSSVVGLIAAVLMMVLLSHDRRIPIAFGPYLAIAGWIAFVFGDQVARWVPLLAVV